MEVKIAETASGSVARNENENGVSIFLSAGRLGEGDIHFCMKITLNEEQLAALLSERFFDAQVELNVNDHQIILKA